MPHTWKDLIIKQVLPEWTTYLIEKRNKEIRENPIAETRTDTLGKKVIRDCREFYRILWKARFGHTNLNEESLQRLCLKRLLQDLDINQEYAGFDIKYYLKFFLRYVKPKRAEKEKNSDVPKNLNILSMFTKYSVIDRDQFLNHPVFGKLFIFLYYTFLPVYLKEIKREFEDMMLHELLNMFDQCLHRSRRDGP